MDSFLRIVDPVLLELHVLAELEEVFVQKWTPRFAASLESPDLVDLLAGLCEESSVAQASMREILANWMSASDSGVFFREHQMDVSREMFLRNLAMFKATAAAVLERAALTAPSPGVAERLRSGARAALEQAERLERAAAEDHAGAW